MNLKKILTVNAVVAFLYAILALLTPATLLSLYAMDLNPGLQLMIRYLGACLLGYGVLSWLARKTTEAVARRAIILGFLTFDVAGVIVSAFGTLSGVMGSFGWSVVGIMSVLGLGFVYLLFIYGPAK
jgi:hypothetical protein